MANEICPVRTERVIKVLDHDIDRKVTTDGEIAVKNLESARRSAWNWFWQVPDRPVLAESIVEYEHLATQFMGDLTALDRLDRLVEHLDEAEVGSSRRSLVHAKVASMTHRFADAKRHLAQATLHGAPQDAVELGTLTVDQACGTNLNAVLDKRRQPAKSGRLEDAVPLGALLARKVAVRVDQNMGLGPVEAKWTL